MTAVVAAVTSATVSVLGRVRRRFRTAASVIAVGGFGDRGGFGVVAAAAAAAVDAVAAVAAASAAAAVVASAAAAAVVSAAAAAVAVAECPQVVGEGKGVVKFFNPQKGFGFIVRDDGGEDVFVHISAVEQAGLTDLADGQPLEFTLVDRGGRISATDLKIEGEPMEVVRSAAPREGARSGGFGGDAAGRSAS